ncbi:MAG: SDR family NAD(P)-dependent oxidoreductase [Pseudomonadota bacterium]
MSLGRVFVTGANRGLGAELVKACLEAGADKIYAGCRQPAELTPDDIIRPVYLELEDSDSIEQAVTSSSDTTILINNAGIIGYEGVMSATSLNHAKQVMDVNLWGTLAVCRGFQPVLVANGGCIVNILSIGALVAYPVAGPYCASKAALFSATQSMRAELASSGVRVVAVFVGPMQTDMVAQHRGDGSSGRSSPVAVARRVVQGIVAGDTDIYADEVADGLRSLYDHKRAEQQTRSRA